MVNRVADEVVVVQFEWVRGGWLGGLRIVYGSV